MANANGAGAGTTSGQQSQSPSQTQRWSKGGIAGQEGMNQLGFRDGKVECSYCWTVKRDVFDIPMLIVMNVSFVCFLPPAEFLLALYFPLPALSCFRPLIDSTIPADLFFNFTVPALHLKRSFLCDFIFYLILYFFLGLSIL
jgi:hypothetical protein